DGAYKEFVSTVTFFAPKPIFLVYSSECIAHSPKDQDFFDTDGHGFFLSLSVNIRVDSCLKTKS
ncbi:MAG: hypothetical protein QME07_05830, partial [bacterium]|nr:hypothetical protein [bacterium]